MSNKLLRAVRKNEETKERNGGRAASSNVKHESVNALSDKNKSTQSLSSTTVFITIEQPKLIRNIRV